MQIANYVTPNIFIIVQKSPKSLAAGALPQTPLGELTVLPSCTDPLAVLGWDGDFKTLYPRQEIQGTRLMRGAIYYGRVYRGASFLGCSDGPDCKDYKWHSIFNAFLLVSWMTLHFSSLIF